MPTVIGINQVPANIPRPRWYDYAGQLYGTQGRQITDALLAALTGGMYKGQIGQVPTTPTPQRPGTLTFPSGATTPTSPQELAQIQAVGGVPSRGGEMVPFGQPSTGGVSYTQPTRLGFKPDLDYLLNQMKVQQASQEMANAPLEKQKLELANQTATQQIKINEDVIKGDLIPVTLPTGQTIYMRPSKSGFVPVSTGKEKSVREQLTDQEFGALGTPALPEELPNPKGMAEGTKATDTMTGQKYVIRKGAWVPR